MTSRSQALPGNASLEAGNNLWLSPLVSPLVPRPNLGTG
jgi:hypothetical protein